jgi:GYF domain 2
MTLYIAKNGQKLGPYSVADAQNLVAAGTVNANDWTWYEGLPNWIPLKQVPGFVTPTVPGERPPLVWVVCLYTFLSSGYSLLSLASIMTMTETDLTTNPPTQHHLIASIGYFQVAAILLKLGLNLTWAILFFMLKRNSLYFILGSLGVGVTLLIYNAVVRDWFAAVGLFGNITAATLWLINLAILYYNWHLYRKGVLR